MFFPLPSILRHLSLEKLTLISSKTNFEVEMKGVFEACF